MGNEWSNILPKSLNARKKLPPRLYRNYNVWEETTDGAKCEYCPDSYSLFSNIAFITDMKNSSVTVTVVRSILPEMSPHPHPPFWSERSNINSAPTHNAHSLTVVHLCFYSVKRSSRVTLFIMRVPDVNGQFCVSRENIICELIWQLLS